MLMRNVPSISTMSNFLGITKLIQSATMLLLLDCYLYQKWIITVQKYSGNFRTLQVIELEILYTSDNATQYNELCSLLIRDKLNTFGCL